MDIEKTKVSVEYLNVIYIFDGDLSKIFGVDDVDVFWFIEDIMSTEESDGCTNALCISAASGKLIWEKTFIEKYNVPDDNEFYLKIMSYVRSQCKIDDKLPINIYQPASPNLSDKNERFKIFWYSVDQII